MRKNQVLITFYESTQSALEGPAAAGGLRRVPGAIVSRSLDGTCEAFDTPAAFPVGAVVGPVLGTALGWVGGEAAVLVGFFFGLYAGLLLDAWRTLARSDLMEEVRGGLGAGQAALVLFVPGRMVGSIERKLAGSGGITLRRFPGRPIEKDLAREAAEASAELRQIVADGSDGQAIAEGQRKVALLESIAERLLWLERLQFDFEIATVNREIKESAGWRTVRLRRRATNIRASHARARIALEASRERAHAAAITAAAAAA